VLIRVMMKAKVKIKI